MALSVIGKHKITVDTAVLDNGDSIAAYLTDAAGALLTSTLLAGKQRLDTISPSEFAEDAPATSGDYGTQVLAVRQDVLANSTSANGDYASLKVDVNGALYTNTTIDFSYDYAEDAPATSGDIGASVLLVRQDTLAASTSADGDYGTFKSNNLGELYVFDTTTHSSLTTANSSLSSIVSNTSSTASTLATFQHAEDAAHVSGDIGNFALAVRNDSAATAFTSADGDYSPIAVDANGRLFVSSTVANFPTFAEDAAATSGDLGFQALVVRNDADTSLVNANGDYAAIQQDALGRIKTISRANVSNLQQRVALTAVAAPLPLVALANRQNLLIQNTGAASIWIGSATVTATGLTIGIEVPKGGSLMVDAGPTNTIYGITSTGTVNVSVWELS